jgi:hypothetical protein
MGTFFKIMASTALLLPTGVAHAQGSAPPGKSVGSAVTQPLADINVKRRELPPEVLAIRDNPYVMANVRNCADITAEVRKLNEALGPDFDEIELDPDARKRKEAAASAAGGLVSSLIPFRFLIREISGATKAERDYREALYAGIVRRAFLKGIGQERKCALPARPLHPLEGASDAAAQVIRGGDDK